MARLKFGKAVVLKGDKELFKQLNRIKKQSTINRVLRPALREASGEIRKAAKRKAPVRSGQLKKSIKNVVRTAKKSKGGGVYALIGPAHGFDKDINGKPNDPVNYAHLVELGTVHSGPKAFLRPAFDTVNSKAIMARRIGVELRKMAAKKR